MTTTRASSTGSVSAPTSSSRSEQVELLLEPFALDVSAAVGDVDEMLAQLDSTDTTVRLRLDSARNRLLWVEIILNAATAAATFGSLIKEIFTTNLSSPAYEVENVAFFWTMACFLLLGSVVGTLVVLHVLSSSGLRVQ